MPRIRSLHPGFWCDDKVAELPFEGRLLFQGLWTFADDAGRVKDNPKQLKAEIFPYDSLSPAQIDSLLRDMNKSGLIHRYSANKHRYIQICHFSDYQSPQHPTPSKIPPPPDSDAPSGEGPINLDRQLPPTITELYVQEIGMMTPTIAEDMIHCLNEDKVPESWIVTAIGIASKQNKKSWAYVAGILKKSKQTGKAPSEGPKPPVDIRDFIPDL